MTDQELLSGIREVVDAIEPGAQILLFGSRARGEGDEESDWDLLILVDGPVNDERADRIRHALYEIEWEHGIALSPFVLNVEDWENPRSRATPFYARVREEGVPI